MVEAAFSRRLDRETRAPIALGLSGGGDSLALLLMAQGWAARHGRPLLALTVDHRLNPDSARWTAQAGEAARAAGAEWRSLAWEGDKPAAGLPAAARAARHRLLAEAARAAEASVVLLGHTLDDVEEGDRMREADAPGLGRVREWSPSPAWPEGRGVFLLRPMLGVRRAALRDWLMSQGLGWLDDPANEDLRFARARARQALNATPGPPNPLPSHDEKGVRGAACDFPPDGGIVVLSRQDFRMADLSRFLSAAILCASGTDVPPRGQRLARLAERVAGPSALVATLGGARITAGASEVRVGREAGERERGGLAMLALRRGAAAVWDGRFEIVTDIDGLVVGPLAGRIGALSREDHTWLKTMPPAARRALPVLSLPDGTSALPRPFGSGPATVRPLVEERLRAACGWISREAAPPS